MIARNKAVLIECPVCRNQYAAMDTDGEYVCQNTDSVYHKDAVDSGQYKFRRNDQVSNVRPTLDVETYTERYERRTTKTNRR